MESLTFDSGVIRHPAAPAPSRGATRAEVLATLRLAGPLAVTQLAQMAINTTDVLMLGWLGPEPLAAASLGLALFYFLFVSGMGVVTGASPLLAQAVGSRQTLRVRRLVQQGFLLTVATAVPLMLVASQGRPILLLLGQDPALVDETHRFLQVLLWSMPGMLGVVFLRCFTTAFGAGRPVLAATLMALPLNALLAYGLIFGGFGMPRLGVVGAGLASALTHAAMFAFLLAWCLLVPRFRRFLVPFRPRLDPAVFSELFRVGLPIGGALLMESGLFSAASLLMGRLGTLPLAAHQVTLQLCATVFMVPLGVGLAATVRVGLAHGAGDTAGARRAGLVACVLGTGFMAITALTFWLGAERLVDLFLDTATAEGAAAAAMAATLLRVAVFFQLADGLQVVGISSLRGLGDTRVPMWLAAFGYWGIGFPVAAILGLGTGLGGVGVWTGLALALGAVAGLMLHRFLRLTRGAGAAGPAR